MDNIRTSQRRNRSQLRHAPAGPAFARILTLFSLPSRRYIIGMVFWAVTFALAGLVAYILARAMTRGSGDNTTTGAFDVQVYRDQLSEVDRDLARGTLDADDADRVRTEISRRILAADAAATRTQTGPVATSAPRVTIAVIVVILVAGSVLLYRQIGAPGYGDLALANRIEMSDTMAAARPDQNSAERQVPTPEPEAPNEAVAEYTALVAQLRGVVKARPDDLEGHRLLAISERNLGNFRAARVAYQTYIDLRGDAADANEYADLADFLILAAGGYISPEAETALERALTAAPGHGPARYYWGLLKSQTGRPDQALQIWDALLRRGPPEAPWIPAIEAQVDDIALRAGVNYARPRVGTGRGPTAADIENAGEMSAADRLDMIAGMVSGLAARLGTEGGPVEDWAQLITSLGVLGRTNDAFIIFENAREVFADDPTAMDLIERAGRRAGVAN